MKARVNLTEVVESAIARVKAEAASFAAQLGLPAKNTTRAADAEFWHFDRMGNTAGPDGPDLWRRFPEAATAARIRCLYSLPICLDPARFIDDICGDLDERIAFIDQNLEVLRTYAPLAAPASEPARYRRWLKEDRHAA